MGRPPSHFSTAVHSEALKAACKAAWAHLTRQQGNIGEASKKEDCWKAFLQTEICLPEGWETELAATPYNTPRTEEEALSMAWERLRHGFEGDVRTMETLEAVTGKQWVRSRRHDTVWSYAVLTWDQLRQKRGLGLKKIRGLIEMFAIWAGA